MRRRVWFLLICLLALPALCFAESPVDPRRILDYLERVRVETDVPGLSAAVSLDGKIVFSGGVGFAELDNRTPQDGRTVHNVGSVSKVLSTVAVMQLVEQGKVDLDATIQTYLPYYPEKQKPITVRRILTHTSGTRHYRDGEFGDYRLASLRQYDSLEEASKIWRDDPLLFEPGAYWLYSSHAMNLLQGVIEKASGEPFEAYMRRHVFVPAAMLETQFDVPSRVILHRGHGYVEDERGHYQHAFDENTSYKFAAGGMLSSVEDLVRFGYAINSGVLMKRETVARMHTPQLDPSVKRFVPGGEPQPLDFEQALGWRIVTDEQGRKFPAHGGSVKGAKTYLANYNEYGLVVAVQGNEDGFNPQGPALAIAQMFLLGR